MIREVEKERVVMGRLPHGGDLLEELTTICRENQIRLGKVTAIGAVQRACISYYNQASKEYQQTTLEEPMEISSLTGNVSLHEGRPMVHAHVNLAREDGSVVGGHLEEGTQIFAAEAVIEVFGGEEFRRSFDGVTGLPLWQKDRGE